MTPEECKKAQNLILRLIGSNLEYIATYELMIKEKHSIWLDRKMIAYYEEWNKDLEYLYKINSLLIKGGFYNSVEAPNRNTPPLF